MATEKVSLTLDSELLRNARLGESLEELDREFGPVPRDLQERVDREISAALARIERAGSGG